MSSDASFDWCSFFALFWNDKGLKCKINIPDTVLFRYGQLSAWWATNKEGYVQRHASHNTSIEAIRRRFIQCAECDDANYSKFVAVVRSGDGQPQLLRLQAFNQLAELLSDRLEAGHTAAAPEVETPQVLQAFIQPHNDLRYVTTYIGGGANNVTCHTFQRKFSRRYVAQGSPLPPAADPDLPSYAATAAGLDEAPDPVTGQGAVDPGLKMEFRRLTSHLVQYVEKAHRLTLAGIVVEWVRDAYGKIYLLSVLRTEWASNAGGNGAGSLGSANLTEQAVELEDGSAAASAAAASAELPPPPPPPPLDPELEAGYGGRGVAWGPSGAGDSGGVATQPNGSPIYAPPPPGMALGSTPPSRAALASLPSRPGSAVSHSASPSPSPVSEVRPPGVPGVGAGTTMSHLASYPGGGRAAGLPVTVSNTWPSHQHEAQLGSPSGRTALAPFGAPSSPYGQAPSPQPSHHHLVRPMSSSFASAQQPRQQPRVRVQSARPALSASTASPMAERQGAAGGSISGGGNGARPPRPGSSPVAFGRSANTSPLRQTSFGVGPPPVPASAHDRAPSPTAASPVRLRPAMSAPGANAVPGAGGGGAAPNPGTGHVNAGTRGAPLMMQQMTRELESARDQLMVQNQMAEASAAKVRQLEREKEVLVAAFDQRVAELHSSLLVARQDLAAQRQEAEEQRRRADEAEARVTELESRSASLAATLDAERGTVMTALRECHERDTNVKQRAEQLEAEVLRLTERLKEESTAVAALKRQLLQYSDIAQRYATTLREGEMEPGMQEVLDRVQKLFSGQANPFGEQYAVQKVLHHYHADLRAVFLYYAQLENNFASHWPPGLAFQQWMLFCRETETSDPRSNSRVSNVTAPHKMLHPRDCEGLFRSYAKLDPTAINTTAPVLSYEGFLCALIDAAFRVKRADLPYLSEAVREYILSYVSRASKMSPMGLRRGQMRDALEGTRDGPPPSPGGAIASKSAVKAKKTAAVALGGHVGPSRGQAQGQGYGGDPPRTTSGTAAGGSLAASRPASAVSRRGGAHGALGAIEADAALASAASGGRLGG